MIFQDSGKILKLSVHAILQQNLPGEASDHRRMPLPAPCVVYETMTRALHRLQLLLVVILLTVPVLQSIEAFNIKGTEHNCGAGGNIICLGDAHIHNSLDSNRTLSGIENIFPGTLSLAHVDVHETGSAGIAYYNEPIRQLDPGTRRIASFNTTFQFFEIPYNGSKGDGMAFVISSDNVRVGHFGYSFGVFDKAGLKLPNTTVIAIEFDNVKNSIGDQNPDINDNHVSIDINNLTTPVATRDASELGIQLSNRTVFAWVEYVAESQLLEVRISYQNSRPSDPFLRQAVRLTEVFEEDMWVGFAASNGYAYSSYYVGDWSFEFNGLPSSSHSPLGKKLGRLGYTAIVMGISGFAVALLLLLMAFRFYRKRKLPASWSVEDGYCSLFEDGKFHLAQDGFRFTFEELSKATGGFADEAKLGEGGFGAVYQGRLPKSNFPVAVKKILRDSQEGEREFRAEVSVISKLRHRNLIRLLGWCIEDGRFYIVYDLMPNGSLDKVILKCTEEGSTAFSWPKRLKVIQGTATAVEYLHHGWDQQVIHRDIKASNIMLDEQWNAKLGDFGLARFTNHQQTPNTITVAGTPGYIAPEAFVSGKFTEKSDVFAFGALVLEVACGRKALNMCTASENDILVDWVWRRLSEGDLLSVVDRRLDEYDVEQMERLLLLGLICSHPDPAARPTIRVVVQVLYGEIPVPPVPRTKPAPIYATPPPALTLNEILSVHVSAASSLLSAR